MRFLVPCLVFRASDFGSRCQYFWCQGVAKVERIRIGADPEPGFEILGLGLGVSGLGPRASGFWLRLSDLAFLVWGFGCQTSSVLFNVSELGFRGSNFGLYSKATGVLFPQT